MLSQLVLLRGVINAIPDQRDQATLTRVDIDELRHAEMDSFKPVTGLLMARLSTGTGWHYGDRIEIEGMLETPPEGEDFSYRDSLARQGIYSLVTRATANQLTLAPDQIKGLHQVASASVETTLRREDGKSIPMFLPLIERLSFHIPTATFADQSHCDQFTIVTF